MPDVAKRLAGAAMALAKGQRIALLVGSAAVVAGVWLYRAGMDAERTRAAAQAAQVSIRTVVETLRVVEVQYRRDTVRLTRWRTRLDTLRLTERITDTLWVRQYITASDSTIRACTNAVTTCERRVALEQQRAALLAQQLKDAQRHRPSKPRRVLTLVGAGAAGLVIGRAIR